MNGWRFDSTASITFSNGNYVHAMWWTNGGISQRSA